MPNTKQTKKPKQPQVKEDVFSPQEIAVVDSLIKLTSGNDKIWRIYWNGAYPWLELESHGNFKITKKLDKELLFGIYNSGMTPYVTHAQLNKETTRLENKITSEVTRLENKLTSEVTRLENKLTSEVTRLEGLFHAELNKTETRIMNEMDKRFAEQDKKIDQKFAEQDKKIDQKFAEQDKKIDQKFAEQDKKFVDVMEALKDIKNTLNQKQ